MKALLGANFRTGDSWCSQISVGRSSGLTASTGGTHGSAGRYYIHHDKALVPIPSPGVLDTMRINWPGGGG
jgi:hypothetical protein